jgi:hypothetical protein
MRCPLAGRLSYLTFYLHKPARARLLLAMPANTVPLWPVPKRSPAHDLWDGCEADAQRGEDAQIEPDGDLAAQPALDDELDQRING